MGLRLPRLLCPRPGFLRPGTFLLKGVGGIRNPFVCMGIKQSPLGILRQSVPVSPLLRRELGQVVLQDRLLLLLNLLRIRQKARLLQAWLQRRGACSRTGAQKLGSSLGFSI